MNQALLIFAKNPVYGKVKTRLAASLGNDVAFSVYKQLFAHTLSITVDLPFEKFLFYSDFIDTQDSWSNDVFYKQVQVGNNLGERMVNAFDYLFDLKCRNAVIIGSDCIELTSVIIMDAFESLNDHDVVVGPAKDGGYYLLGMNRKYPELFKNMDWSSDKVLQQTLSVCEQLNLSVHLLPELSDIDDENDLKRINGQMQVNVII